jgi:mono/diheme cytochrome c family protein
MSRLRRFRLLISSVALVLVALAFGNAASTKDGDRTVSTLARDILSRRCFACHGANGVARKNIFVLDRDRLVASRTIIPRDTNSLLLTVVESGAMPMNGPELSRDEKDVLRNWIASGAPNWDDTKKSNRTFLTEPALLALIRNDLLQTNDRSRPFLRYFSLSHLYNAGVSDEELDTDRAALSKLVNSLSWHREITPLMSIDPSRTIFRIDLRDYNWTAATWNLLLAVYPYGIRSADSRVIDRLSGSPLPYLRGDWFVANASIPPLYHDILGLPRTVRELEQALGIEAARDLREEKNVVRAGLRSSAVSQNNRVLERHVSPHGAYWKSFDFRSNLDDQNIFKDPLRLNPAGGEIIFNLPNGLQAYFLTNAFGQRIDEAPISIVSDRNNPDDPVIRNGRSCMSCHYTGIQSFKDEVRPVVRGLSFASFDQQKALALYPEQDTLDRLIERDRNRFEQSVKAIAAASASAQAEPVNALSHRFLAEMSVSQAAAEAGLEASEFQARISRSPRLLERGYGQLLVRRGGIRRDAWDRNFGDLARELDLGDYLASVIVLSPSTNAARLPNPSGRAIRTAVPVFGSDPNAILRSARTIFVRSMTVYLEAEQFEDELRKRPEFNAMGLMIVRDEKVADIRIDINRAEFSFNYSFTATNPDSSIVVSSGKVTAWNGDFAGPRLAKEFLMHMQTVRSSSQ